MPDRPNPVLRDVVESGENPEVIVVHCPEPTLHVADDRRRNLEMLGYLDLGEAGLGTEVSNPQVGLTNRSQVGRGQL